MVRINQFAKAASEAIRSFPRQHLVVDDLVDEVVARPVLFDQFSQTSKTENQKTWTCFRKALVKALGKERFDWICERYQFNFKEREKKGAVFLPKHVKLFSVGSSQVRTCDLKQGSLKRVSELTLSKLKKRIKAAQPLPLIGKVINPLRLFTSPSKLKALFFHNTLLMDEEKQALFKGTGLLHVKQYIERFCKVTVNRELIEKQLIPAITRSGKHDYYKVYKKISSGNGLIAYALKPATHDSKLSPMVVFRPTQASLSAEDAIPTFLDDFRIKIGKVAYDTAFPELKELMRDVQFRAKEQKIEIAGYSYGGVCAQRFLTDFHSDIIRATFYGDPSVDKRTAKLCAARMNHSPRRKKNPLSIVIYRVEGDFCDHVGDRHAGWGVTHPDVKVKLVVADHPDEDIASHLLHSFRLHDAESFDYKTRVYTNPKELFNHLDNTRRSIDVRWYYQAHKVWGRAVYISIFVLQYLIKAVSKILELPILRKSEPTSSSYEIKVGEARAVLKPQGIFSFGY